MRRKGIPFRDYPVATVASQSSFAMGEFTDYESRPIPNRTSGRMLRILNLKRSFRPKPDVLLFGKK
jgi:hypothetical protein